MMPDASNANSVCTTLRPLKIKCEEVTVHENLALLEFTEPRLPDPISELSAVAILKCFHNLRWSHRPHEIIIILSWYLIME